MYTIISEKLSHSIDQLCTCGNSTLRHCNPMFVKKLNVLTSKASDSEAVGGMELSHEEFATCFPDGGHLKKTGGGEKDLEKMGFGRQELIRL